MLLPLTRLTKLQWIYAVELSKECRSLQNDGLQGLCSTASVAVLRGHLSIQEKTDVLRHPVLEDWKGKRTVDSLSYRASR